MDNDDQQVGRILSRREVLALFGLAGAAALAGCAADEQASATPTLNAEARTAVSTAAAPTAQAERTAVAATVETANATAPPSCVVRPELTEGPFFVDVQLDRSDIRSDPATGAVKAGTPLELSFQVLQVSAAACTPLEGAVVDIWQCDADGVYPGIEDQEQSLRGFQRTDAAGMATFVTIYPGWYPGRTVHIHFKIRTDLTAQAYEFTSQLFFDEQLTAQVYQGEPYAARGEPNTSNSRDGIFADELLVTAAPSRDGYAASFSIALDLAA